MMIIVTANSSTGPVSITCETANEALEAALGLMNRGTDDVLIDAGGTRFAPVEFRLRFIDPPDTR